MKTVFSLLILGFLAACGSTNQDLINPADKGMFKIGKPYQINGKWYRPSVDWDYDETGIASWYGAPFHGRPTANGEVFDKEQLTAAHTTLPLPSVVRVTNLDTDKEVVVRINDRGPFVGGRIIDLSYAAAKSIGMDRTGTGKVRVQILPEESKQAALAAGAREEQLVASGAPARSIENPEVYETPVARGVAPERSGRAYSDGGVMFVQAGAFSSKDNAYQLANSLNFIYTANVAPTVSGGKQLYRVRLGPVNTVNEADDVLAKVVSSGHDSAKIVVE